MAVAACLAVALALQGCFDPVYPQRDREARVIEALDAAETRDLPPSPLSPGQAVSYALAHSLDAKVAELDAEYQDASRVAARRRLLPSLTARYSLNHANHPSARWSESTKSGNQSLESSYSSEQTTRPGEIGVMWNILDFGVGYLRARQQGERVRHSEQQRRRVRQQIVLDVLTQYWRAAAAMAVAADAEIIAAELERQGEAVRDSVELRILSGAEGARRELAVHSGLAELEQYRRSAAQAKLELAKVMGCDGTAELRLADVPGDAAAVPEFADGNPWMLQAAALKRRPELYQQDTQERIAEDEARLALVQMAPNANLSFNLNHDPDKFLEWSNWMTVGARVSWNLFNIPARLAERRMAKLQGEMAKKKGLSLAAAVMAQVGIAYSDWRLAADYAGKLDRRAAARERLVEALAAGEQDGQTRPGEVLQERVRLLAEKGAALRAAAEVRVAGARLANAIGLDPDDEGNLVWRLDGEEPSRPGSGDPEDKARLAFAEEEAEKAFPGSVAGVKVVKAEDFLAGPEYFSEPAAGEDAAAEAGAGAAESPEDEQKSSEKIPPGASDKEAAAPLQTMAPPLPAAAFAVPDAPETAVVDTAAATMPGAAVRGDQTATSAAGSLPYALAASGAETEERGRARSRALEPLASVGREKSGLRPPRTVVKLPPASLKPPGK